MIAFMKLFDGSASDFGRHLLMALGGALIGGLLTALILLLLWRMVGVKKIPRRLTLMLSIMGGVVGGWLVWSLLSPGGGYGPGPGGAIVGGGPSGTFISTGKDGSTKREPNDALRVVVVRSRDYEPESKRYYLVEGRPPARTLAETVQVIKDRHQLNPAMKVVEVVIYQDSIAETRGLADDLEDPVKPLGMSVKTHKPGTDAP